MRAALSAAFTSLLYVDSGLADAGTAAQLEAFAKTQLDYALGAPDQGLVSHLPAGSRSGQQSGQRPGSGQDVSCLLQLAICALPKVGRTSRLCQLAPSFAQ